MKRLFFITLTFVVGKSAELIPIDPQAESYLHFPSVKIILDFVTFTPDLYNIQIHAEANFILRNVEFETYKKCFPCVFLFYERECDQNLEILPFITRFTQPEDLIFVDNLNHSYLSLNITKYFAQHITTIYLIYWNSFITMGIVEQLYPAVKFLIGKYEGLGEVGSFICRGFCPQHGYILNVEFLQQFRNSILLHKLLLWKAFGRQVQTYGVGYKYYLESTPLQNRYICIDYVGTGKSNKLSSMCDPKLLATLYLGKIHNLSFTILNAYSVEAEAQFKSGDQYISSYGGARDETISYYIKTGYAMVHSAKFMLLYCIRRSDETDVHAFWVDALQVNIWILSFLIFLIFTMLFWKTKLLRVFASVRIVLGQDVIIRHKSIICCTIFFYFIRTFFENALTSLVVVPPTPDVYENLREAIFNNYKILVDKITFVGATPQQAFLPDFQRNKISELINQSFSEIPSNLSDAKVTKTYLIRQSGTKFALCTQEHLALITKYAATMHLREQIRSSDVSCQYVKQALNPIFHFFIFNVVNRHWVMLSFEKLREGGLLTVWRKWREDLLLLIQREKFRETETLYPDTTYQIVEFRHIYPVCMLLIIMCMVAMLTLLLEQVISLKLLTRALFTKLYFKVRSVAIKSLVGMRNVSKTKCQ